MGDIFGDHYDHDKGQTFQVCSKMRRGGTDRSEVLMSILPVYLYQTMI